MRNSYVNMLEWYYYNVLEYHLQQILHSFHVWH